MSIENNEILKPFIEHLEFLGYTVEPTSEEKKFYRAKEHPTRWSLVFTPYRDKGVFFTAAFGCEPSAKANPIDIFKFANNLNASFFLCRAVVDKDSDISIEVCFTKIYDRREFGIFMDQIEAEIRNAMDKNKEEAKRILI